MAKEQTDKISKSSNFRLGKFQNTNHTPAISEGFNTLNVLYRQMFQRAQRRSPVDTIPSIKTNLKNIDLNDNILIWFGHSSYFMQIDGMRFLVDPVLCGRASPIPNTIKSYQGTDVYSVEDIPEIDYLFISHDHYDHVDSKTLIGLKNRIKKVVCGLGVGAHFERWGYSNENIIEADWNE